MPPSLLADLAALIASSPEDVATRGLDVLLGRSAAGQAALNRLMSEIRGKSGRPVTRWASQVAESDEARTDLQGYAADGSTVAILENKFWAGLTDNQPATYLRRIAPGDGLLLFVVPSTRVLYMAHELALRIPSDFPGASSNAYASGPVLSRSADGRTLAIVSWDSLFGALQTSMEAAEEFDNLADLRQLQALAAKMDTESFRPLTSEDLTGDSPRVLLHICDLVDAAVQQLLTRPYANKNKLKASAGKGWYGHYVWIHGFGCQVLMTAWRWANPGFSPVWLRIASPEWSFPEGIRPSLERAISDAHLIGEVRSREWPGYWIPILLPEHREREAVVLEMVRQIEIIAGALAAHALVGTEISPPEAADELTSPA